MASDARALYASHPGSLTISRPRALGFAWIVYGILRFAVTLWLIAFTATATLMFGALLTRVPNPFALMSDFHILYTAIVVWSGASCVLGLIAGITLLLNQRSARILAIAAALISLAELPFGIMLGVYTMVHTAPARDATR
jgi:hypothetical protein